jgi:hypothetical protein
VSLPAGPVRPRQATAAVLFGASAVYVNLNPVVAALLGMWLLGSGAAWRSRSASRPWLPGLAWSTGPSEPPRILQDRAEQGPWQEAREAHLCAFAFLSEGSSKRLAAATGWANKMGRVL